MKLIDFLLKECYQELRQINANATSNDPCIWMNQIDDGIARLAYKLQEDEEPAVEGLDFEKLCNEIDRALCSL